MSGTCGAQQGEEHCACPRFLKGNMKERNHMECLGTDMKRLKWVLQKLDGGCGPESSISR